MSQRASGASIRMRLSLVLGFALVGCLAVSGSSLAIMETVATAAAYAQDLAADPAGHANTAALFATGEVFACTHASANCVALEAAGPVLAQVPADPSSVPGLVLDGAVQGIGTAYDFACAKGILAPAGLGFDLTYGASDTGASFDADIC